MAGVKARHVDLDDRPLHMQAAAHFPATTIKVFILYDSLVVYVQLEIVKGKQQAMGKKRLVIKTLN